MDEIFDHEQRANFRPPDKDLSDQEASAQFLLRLEHLNDRTQGYAFHLEKMLAASFEPIAVDCRERLGFSPTILPALVRGCHAELQRRYERLRPRLMRAVGDLRKVDPSRLAMAFSESFAGFFEYRPDEVAAKVGLEEGEVRAAFKALATSFGEIPSDLRPRMPNRVRRFPVVPLAEDSFFFALQWNPLHEFVPWFLEFARQLGEDRLVERFLRSRDIAAENLTKEAFGKVFGWDAVHGPLDYEVEGMTTELDCLVDAWPLCLLVEVKAHRVNEAVKRGSVDRIRRLDADLGKARKQALRASRYVLDGGHEFRKSGSGESVRLEAAPRDVARIAVSFERVDPLSLVGGLDVQAEERIWNVSLADLLMLTEVLDDPSSFVAYAEQRAKLIQDPGMVPLMEADLLGGFLARRLLPERRLKETSSDALRLVGYQAGELNNYFTARDVGVRATRPTSGVPKEILLALRYLMENRHPEWHNLALVLMAEDPSAWAGWGKQLRRARRGGRNLKHYRSYEIELPISQRLVLLVSKGKSCFSGLEAEAERLKGVLIIAERQAPHPRELKAEYLPASRRSEHE